jgi:hypothetical protein
LKRANQDRAAKKEEEHLPLLENSKKYNFWRERKMLYRDLPAFVYA